MPDAVPQPRGLEAVVGTRLDPFLRGFGESSFRGEVESFIDQAAPSFVVPCPDGSNPLSWTELHSQYCELFDRQLVGILDELDIERDEFLEWYEALVGAGEHLEDAAELPGTGGVRVSDFRGFAKALTASEDYELFRSVLLQRAAQQQQVVASPLDLQDALPPVQPTSGGYASHTGGYGQSGISEAPPLAPLCQEIDVLVPEGYGPGQVIAMQYLGARYELVVPDGHHSGTSFRASVQLLSLA
eukprot:TRINITY_DN29913_c0_g1_i1.p1 TRINITY_DN29913_c0_g1~~TRINITY_DN29913_c0_g1_i1.p1  ORF type:complete len:243 (-),score=40.72 TRINITY_DN29913_c0_g1_i1:99-827(-)